MIDDRVERAVAAFRAKGRLGDPVAYCQAETRAMMDLHERFAKESDLSPDEGRAAVELGLAVLVRSLAVHEVIDAAASDEADRELERDPEGICVMLERRAEQEGRLVRFPVRPK